MKVLSSLYTGFINFINFDLNIYQRSRCISKTEWVGGRIDPCKTPKSNTVFLN